MWELITTWVTAANVLASSGSVVVTVAVLAMLLCWFIIGAKGYWLIKGGLIIGVGAFSLLLFNALDTTEGWPTHAKLPDKVLFISGSIDEPDWIYIYAIPPKVSGGIYGYTPDATAPRSYVLPYSKGLHDAVDQANELRKTGQPVEFAKEQGSKGNGTRPPEGEIPAGGYPGRGTGGNGQNAGQGGSQPNGGYHAYVLPPPVQSVKP